MTHCKSQCETCGGVQWVVSQHECTCEDDKKAAKLRDELAEAIAREMRNMLVGLVIKTNVYSDKYQDEPDQEYYAHFEVVG
jgi:hypothetical protein